MGIEPRHVSVDCVSETDRTCKLNSIIVHGYLLWPEISISSRVVTFTSDWSADVGICDVSLFNIYAVAANCKLQRRCLGDKINFFLKIIQGHLTFLGIISGDRTILFGVCNSPADIQIIIASVCATVITVMFVQLFRAVREHGKQQQTVTTAKTGAEKDDKKEQVQRFSERSTIVSSTSVLRPSSVRLLFKSL
jgi:hypothetical protein